MTRIRYLEYKHQLHSNELMGDKDLYWAMIDLDKQTYLIYNSKGKRVAKGSGESRTDLLKRVRSEFKAVGVKLDDQIIQRRKGSNES